jgi:hypothetical protein
MDKFGEVTGDEYSTDINIDKSLFSLHQSNWCEIAMWGSSMNLKAPHIYLDSNTTANNGLNINYPITDGLQAVNKSYVDENKEDFSNKKDIITKDIAENELDAYPTVGAVYNFVNEQIGDIETALTNIEAIQDALIGGNV